MPIRILPLQLANQIAAGEVIDRPSSVVKELVENSLDAGATHIEIDIKKGGSKLIHIRDNGCGIPKDELSIALSRYATSKIASIDDLENIMSFGFRGEALSSISSVSRLILTSNTAYQNEAWQTYSEGRDMQVIVKPAAHPIGTSLDVLDLFYNTPARRRFLCSEKTEFQHIKEVIKRIALTSFNVSLVLTHNGKLISKYNAVNHDTKIESRLSLICGKNFIQNALRIDWHHNDLSLNGWIADPNSWNKIPNIQYCYVNKRIVRNKLFKHAIHQAYQIQIRDNNHPPSYVLYLNINPRDINVNVHPAKHEIKFHQSRLVHDFILQSIINALQTNSPTDYTFYLKSIRNLQSAGDNQFIQPVILSINDKENSFLPLSIEKNKELNNEQNSSILKKDINHNINQKNQLPVETFGRVLHVFDSRYALLEKKDSLKLLSLSVANRFLKYTQIFPGKGQLKSKPLIIPILLKITDHKIELINIHSAILNLIGIDLQVEKQHLILRAVPIPLLKQNLKKLIEEMLNYLAHQQNVSIASLTEWLVDQQDDEKSYWNYSQAVILLAELEKNSPQLLQLPPSNLIQNIEIKSVINELHK
ncbi:DNA mismatch repair endonuclease MutL [Pantoea sp. Aalb]|uniref:DNA mismatch repair endonuclease MutL n=1 Tax=Pantoea sp. Aalb TaxID=2576762 RepID=UPI001322C300|nr:DNA mismatch repair endonuclease MutL [Pantoea sp. Aalb]MXP67675.1 DNA mismatch repair endonuclease MutL [Pantoea sp. Aalb]